MTPISLYIHIPFCKSKCTYCDFCSFTSNKETMTSYSDVLIKEIRQESPAFKNVTVDTVFIGGGTPTIIPPLFLEKILTALEENFQILPDAEYTCEANPGTISQAHFDLFRKKNINRLSLGAQAYQPEHLSRLGRIHTWEDVKKTVSLAHQNNISNINIDLMFGLPGQSLLHWRETLAAASALPLRHLSCYGLIVEEGTMIQKQLEKGLFTLPDEQTEREMYDTCLSFLAQKGFKQYEISNFAQEGYECRHNIGYWQNHYYLGLGLAAHSKLPSDNKNHAYVRRANPEILSRYISALEQGHPLERETTLVTKEESVFETIMTGLRLTDGISNKAFYTQHGMTLEEAFPSVITPLIQKQLLFWHNNHLALTRKGMDVQNSILVEFMP